MKFTVSCSSVLSLDFVTHFKKQQNDDDLNVGCCKCNCRLCLQVMLDFYF